jgi:hypothetical protein
VLIGLLNRGRGFLVDDVFGGVCDGVTLSGLGAKGCS